MIIDFSQYAGKTLYLENRLLQPNGQGGPTGSVSAAGQGFLMLQIVVDQPAAADNSADPGTIASFYTLPSVSATPVVTRNFNFDQGRNGQWTINGSLFSCTTPRFTVKQGSLEQWNFQNGWNWSHPIHVHMEEHQVIKGAPGTLREQHRRFYRLQPLGQPVLLVRLQHGKRNRREPFPQRHCRLTPRSSATIKMRFRDWLGRYVMHCHNVIHEDHAMMLRFDVGTTGDTNSNP